MAKYHLIPTGSTVLCQKSILRNVESRYVRDGRGIPPAMDVCQLGTTQPVRWHPTRWVNAAPEVVRAVEEKIRRQSSEVAAD